MFAHFRDGHIPEVIILNRTVYKAVLKLADMIIRQFVNQ